MDEDWDSLKEVRQKQKERLDSMSSDEQAAHLEKGEAYKKELSEFTLYYSQFQKWYFRDFWTPEVFAALLNGLLPENITFNDSEVSEQDFQNTLEQIQGDLGGSLGIRDSETLNNQLGIGISKADCLCWPVPGKFDPHPLWKKALKWIQHDQSEEPEPTLTELELNNGGSTETTPESQPYARRDAIRNIKQMIDKRAKKAGIKIDFNELRANREHMEILISYFHPEVRIMGKRTMRGAFNDAGIRLKSGDQKNILEQLFPEIIFANT